MSKRSTRARRPAPPAPRVEEPAATATRAAKPGWAGTTLSAARTVGVFRRALPASEVSAGRTAPDCRSAGSAATSTLAARLVAIPPAAAARAAKAALEMTAAPRKSLARALLPEDFVVARPAYAVWELTMKC